MEKKDLEDKYGQIGLTQCANLAGMDKVDDQSASVLCSYMTLNLNYFSELVLSFSWPASNYLKCMSVSWKQCDKSGNK